MCQYPHVVLPQRLQLVAGRVTVETHVFSTLLRAPRCSMIICVQAEVRAVSLTQTRLRGNNTDTYLQCWNCPITQIFVKKPIFNAVNSPLHVGINGKLDGEKKCVVYSSFEFLISVHSFNCCRFNLLSRHTHLSVSLSAPSP